MQRRLAPPCISYKAGYEQHLTNVSRDQCFDDQFSEELVGCTGEAGTSLLKLPIYIEDFFPPNTWALIFSFQWQSFSPPPSVKHY